MTRRIDTGETVTAATAAIDRTAALATVFSDPPAFREWYDTAVVRVYGYLHGRCGGDDALAEDLTQQTFIQAIKHWQSYDGRADPITWLCSIARNKLTDHYRVLDRQERRHLRLVVREISVAEAAPVDAIADRDAVLMALRNMPALHRAALVLRYVDGLSVRDVARELGRSESATDSLIRRAKERFKATYPEAVDG